MAEDVFAFIQQKGLRRPAVYGWSDGGIVALELESMHPGTCSLLVTSGANVTAENALVPEVFDAIFSEAMQAETVPPLVRMMLDEPDMTAEDLQRIAVPVLVCAGTNDLILPGHTRMIAETLPKGEMLIVPDADHGSYIYHNPQMGEIMLDFLKKQHYGRR